MTDAENDPVPSEVTVLYSEICPIILRVIQYNRCTEYIGKGGG